MRKIVINTSFDRFCLRHKAFLRLRALGVHRGAEGNRSGSVLAGCGRSSGAEP